MGIDVYAVFREPQGLPLTIPEALRAIQALPVSATVQRRVLRAWADATGRLPTPEDYRSLRGTPATPVRSDRYV